MLTDTEIDLKRNKWRIYINSILYSLEHKKINREKALELIIKDTKDIFNIPLSN